MVFDYFDKFIFICEMEDEQKDNLLELSLHYFPFDHSAQVVDTINFKIFLKRIQLPDSFTTQMLRVGNTVTIYNRLLRITECIPNNHFEACSIKRQNTFALIKPVSSEMHGKIITFILNNGFEISRMKNGILDRDVIIQIYKHLSGSHVLPLIFDYMMSGVVIGLELTATDAVRKWTKCLGSTDPKHAAPGTLRNMYGIDILKNVAHASNTPEIAKADLDLYFGYDKGILRVPFRATFKNCTCCIIKPHTMFDGSIGFIWDMISKSDKFEISAAATFNLTLPNALEFFEVYEGVLPEYKDMSLGLCNGRSVVLEITCKDPNKSVVKEFRIMCGPRDPDLARQLYPNTLRARYGKDLVNNAVHCTDLAEDGVTEVEYFYRILANMKTIN